MPVLADFALTDDLLWRAFTRGNAVDGPFTLAFGGFLGPLVELCVARRTRPDAFRSVQLRGQEWHAVELAATKSIISGLTRGSRWGLFPFVRAPSLADAPPEWEQWRLRLQHAAELVDFPRVVAKQIVGALTELVDNIYEHSQAPVTGIAGYYAHDGAVEFVVSDAGIGVLASLRRAPLYADLSDTGIALRAALQDGVTSRVSGRGGDGIGSLFRALAGYEGELRFRSGDHALTIRGRTLSLAGHVEVAQRAPLPGLTISILCRSPRRPFMRT